MRPQTPYQGGVPQEPTGAKSLLSPLTPGRYAADTSIMVDGCMEMRIRHAPQEHSGVYIWHIHSKPRNHYDPSFNCVKIRLKIVKFHTNFTLLSKSVSNRLFLMVFLL